MTPCFNIGLNAMHSSSRFHLGPIPPNKLTWIYSLFFEFWEKLINWVLPKNTHTLKLKQLLIYSRECIWCEKYSPFEFHQKILTHKCSKNCERSSCEFICWNRALIVALCDISRRQSCFFEPYNRKQIRNHWFEILYRFGLTYYAYK